LLVTIYISHSHNHSLILRAGMVGWMVSSS